VSFFDNFDKIYCINLSHRKDRWEKCIHQFHTFGISDKVIRYEPKISQREWLSRKANAQISCALSHYSIMSESLVSGCHNVLILEDDFYFPNDWNWTCKKLSESWQELPRNWDIFYFGTYLVKGYDYPPAVSYSKNLVRVQTGFCCHAMAYSQKGLKLVLNDLKITSEPEIHQFSKDFESFDWFLVRYIQMHSQCFAPQDLLCVQSSGHSDIEGKNHDYLPMFVSSHKNHIMGMGSLS